MCIRDSLYTFIKFLKQDPIESQFPLKTRTPAFYTLTYPTCLYFLADLLILVTLCPKRVICKHCLFSLLKHVESDEQSDSVTQFPQTEEKEGR